MNFKSLLIVVCIAFNLTSFSQKIKLKDPKQKFGFVHEGDTVKLNYELRNIGDKPLIITNYDVECGCTSMEIPTEPIAPGATYILKVKFDTHEKYDRQDRTVTLISNAIGSPAILRFKGVVLKPRQAD